MKNLFDQIPGYREACEAERFARDLAFAEVPEDVCGIAVGPLNWLRFIRLALIGSPFVCGGNITPSEVAAALWLISTDYDPGARFKRWCFLQRLRRKSYLKLCAGLDAYFQDALDEAPGGQPVTGPSYYSAIAAHVDCFAHEYGWSEAAVVRLPFKQLFQLLRCIQSRHGDKIFFNPSDRVRGEWLQQQNEGKN